MGPVGTGRAPFVQLRTALGRSPRRPPLIAARWHPGINLSLRTPVVLVQAVNETL